MHCSPWRRAPRGADGGFTLVEVVVAVGVLSTVMLPLAGVFVWGAAADASNREYGAAIAIADGYLAKADSIGYGGLGFYENQFGTPPVTIPSYNGQPGVDLGASPAAGATAEVPVSSTPLQVGSISYVEHTYAVWVNGSGGQSDAYKQVYAVVTWNAHGQSEQVVENELVYPGGLGKYTGPENTAAASSSGSPDNVGGLAVSVPADPAGETEVNLSWTAPPDPTGYYAVVWATSSSDLATPGSSGTTAGWAPAGSTSSGSIQGTATSYQVSGLAPDTKYWFEVVGFSSDGSHWAVSQSSVTATTLQPPAQPCTLSAITVDQGGQSAGQATVAKSNGHLIQAVTITVTFSGTCTSNADAVTVSATSSGSDPGSPYSLVWGANQYSYTLCPPTGFATGTHTYTASHNGTSTNLTAQVAFTQDKKSSPAC